MITRTNYSVVKEIVSQELKGIEIKKEISGGWGFHGSSAGKESACNAGDLGLIPGLRRSPREGIGYPLQYSWASLVAQMVKKKSACNVGDLGWIPGFGRSPGEGNGYPLKYSCLENPMHRGV